MNTIWKFVLTGGPCGGKTTAIPKLKEFLENKGFKVFIIPEAATIVNGNMGLTPYDLSVYDFQLAIIETELYLENVALKFANQFKEDVIILHDRGLLDTKAYMTDENFIKALKETNLSESKILNNYDAIFHMVTAASGAEDSYYLSGVRTETPEVARELDSKTLDAWKNHPNLYVFDNSTNFTEKLNNLICKITEILEKR